MLDLHCIKCGNINIKFDHDRKMNVHKPTYFCTKCYRTTCFKCVKPQHLPHDCTIKYQEDTTTLFVCGTFEIVTEDPMEFKLVERVLSEETRRLQNQKIDEIAKYSFTWREDETDQYYKGKLVPECTTTAIAAEYGALEFLQVFK